MKRMTPFELLYLFYQPFSPALYGEVRKRIAGETRPPRSAMHVLDVGGRKSHYTIGLPIQVTISDIHRSEELQEKLNLGITDSIIAQTMRRRSNLTGIVYDDMVYSTLPSNSYDAILAVEVLEHIAEDEAFLKQVYRVLRPGGFFLMTTPNGDHYQHPVGDHKRHYKKEELAQQIKNVFDSIDEISYIVADTNERQLGLRSLNVFRPIQCIKGMYANKINRLQSTQPGIQVAKDRTCHIIALSRKA